MENLWDAVIGRCARRQHQGGWHAICATSDKQQYDIEHSGRKAGAWRG
jgi:hypothetical protein